MSDTRLDALGMSGRVAALVGADSPPSPRARLGRVVRVDRGHARVGFGPTGSVLVTVAPTMTPEGPPVVGDWLWLVDGDGPDDLVVAAVAPRWSRLARATPEATSPVQVLAANVDVVCVVCGVDRPLRPGRVERMLAATHQAGARPVAVVTKADLDDPAPLVRSVQDLANDIEVVVTSASTRVGIDELARCFAPDLTGVLLGESGAGKSSLVNRLVGADVLDVGEVRETDQKGRHTTTHRQLVPLATGGVLVDSPGVRAFALWDVGDGLARTFPEIDELSERCRFRDCRHDAEPGCAVTAALADGRIDAERFERYREMLDEHHASAGLADQMARRERDQRGHRRRG